MRLSWTTLEPAGFALLLFIGACSANANSESPNQAPTTEPNSRTTVETTTTMQEEPDRVEPSIGDLIELPERAGPRRETTGDVPHIQLNAEPDPNLGFELRRRVFRLPGVDDQPSERSLPGARGLWLEERVDVVRDDVLGPSREFAHIHPDGSLHIWLPVERAQEVHDTQWGELHPWVGREGFWDGVVMVFTPETMEDVEVTVQLVVDAYNFITGAEVTPADIP